MRERVKSLEIFERKPIPTWGVDLSDLDLSELVLYSPPEAGRYDSWDDVPEEQKRPSRSSAFPRPSASTWPSRGRMAAGALLRGLKQEYADKGIIFCAMDTAVQSTRTWSASTS